ncbi:SSI family serine proteinase inhibitor [Glutamicibacter endophyticus]
MNRARIVAIATALSAAIMLSACQPPAAAPGPSESNTSTSSPPQTDLRIEVFADGKELSAEHRLFCAGRDPLAQSTLPAAASACQLLHDSPALLTEPTPTKQTCTMIYGGPDRATIRGTLNGISVDATFDRSNGCAIDRWDTLQSLLGSGGM